MRQRIIYLSGDLLLAMTTFALYFSLGREHILDINGYDHILFVIALCTMYAMSDWKKVVVLVTAFTIGHSITLALVILNLFSVNVKLIEFLISGTIFITAVGNIWNSSNVNENRKMSTNYFFALFFGLIHGMGFSNYLKSLLGSESSIVTELLAFNLGLELGQVIIVVAFMTVGYLVRKYINVTRRDWILSVSSAVAGVGLTLMVDTKFW